MRHLLILLLCTTCIVPTTSASINRWWTYARTCILDGEVNPGTVPPVEVSPESREQQILVSCKADVGACPVGKCRYNPDRPATCSKDGVICPVTESRVVDCGGDFGIHDVMFVTACTCCKANRIIIRGNVMDSDDKSPIADANLRSGAAFSNQDGSFSFNVKSGTARLSIRAHKSGYLPALRVTEIPPGFQGTVDVVIAMVKIAGPVTIDATKSNEFPITSDMTGESRATIIIPSGSFRFNGAVYTGIVSISVNFMDPSNLDVEEEIVGEFTTSSGDSLITGGIFAITFRADTGDRLTLQAIIRVPVGMMLWELNNMGRWVLIQTTNRRKRQIALTEDFVVAIQSGRWINIDKITNAPVCFFKARVFDQLTQEHISESNVTSFRPSVVTFTTRDERLPFYPDPTTQPASTCHKVRCPNITTDPNMTLVGLIGMTSFETVLVDGESIPVVTNLLPRGLPQYKDFFATSILQTVEYEVIPVRNEAFVNFILNDDGPFYSDLTECQDSAISAPSFHFLKPELPSYLPIPNDTAICTVRIGFHFSFDLSELDSFNNSTPPLAATATSTWTVDETNSTFYYTDSSLLQFDDDDDRFAHLCVNYRCSDMEVNTTVYIGIDIPDVIGDMIMLPTPAFECTSRCMNCPGRVQLPTGINGLLVAPLDIPADGPDYFQDMPNSCGQQLNNETAGALINCHLFNMYINTNQ